MTKRAKDDLLGELHEAIAQELLHRVKTGEATPADLSAAIRFLKDNKIEAVMEQGDTLDQLYKNLPTFDDEVDDYIN
jgi:hypothetical protein